MKFKELFTERGSVSKMDESKGWTVYGQGKKYQVLDIELAKFGHNQHWVRITREAGKYSIQGSPAGTLINSRPIKTPKSDPESVAKAINKELAVMDKAYLINIPKVSASDIEKL